MNLGQAAFQTYREMVAGLTHDGRPIPSWDNLTEPIRLAWTAGAERVARLVRDQERKRAAPATTGRAVRCDAGRLVGTLLDAWEFGCQNDERPEKLVKPFRAIYEAIEAGTFYAPTPAASGAPREGEAHASGDPYGAGPACRAGASERGSVGSTPTAGTTPSRASAAPETRWYFAGVRIPNKPWRLGFYLGTATGNILGAGLLFGFAPWRVAGPVSITAVIVAAVAITFAFIEGKDPT